MTRFKILVAIMRQLLLVATMLLLRYKYDVIIVDQLPAALPLLFWFTTTPILFYCHYPDQLLSTHR